MQSGARIHCAVRRLYTYCPNYDGESGSVGGVPEGGRGIGRRPDLERLRAGRGGTAGNKDWATTQLNSALGPLG
eukprot:7838838-Alexandrium_andersonii.AAC.1